MNEACKKALLNLKESGEIFRYNDTFIKLSQQVRYPGLLWRKLEALSIEEDERLDAYLKDKSVLFPCVLFEPSLGKVTEVTVLVNVIFTIIIFQNLILE